MQEATTAAPAHRAARVRLLPVHRNRLRLTRPLAVIGLALACWACGGPPPTGAPTGPATSPAPPAGTDSPTATEPSSGALTPVPGDVDACTWVDLVGEVDGQGATGSIAILVRVTNTGASSCSLSGAPASVAIRAGGGNLPFEYHQEPWRLGAQDPSVAPPVILAPGATAQAGLVWANWCLGPAAVDTVWIALPHASDERDLHPPRPLDAPRCDVEGQPSTVTAFAFEPASP